MYYRHCKDCKERYLGCHDKCEHYKEFKEECKKITEERQKRQDLDRYFLGKQRENNEQAWLKFKRKGRKTKWSS